MKRKEPKIEYYFTVQNISDSKKPAYRAYIPAFDAFVFGGSMTELGEGIHFMIETEIEDLKKEGKPIPTPEHEVTHSGKLALRIDPLLHTNLAQIAKSKGKSLNTIIAEQLKSTTP